MPSSFDGYPPRERVKQLMVKCKWCEGTDGYCGPPAKTPEGDWIETACPKCGGTQKVEVEF